MVNLEVGENNGRVTVTLNCGPASLEVIDSRDTAVELDSSPGEDSDLDAAAFVSVAELCQGVSLLGQDNICRVVLSWAYRGNDEIVAPWDLSHELDGVEASACAHAGTASLHVVGALDSHSELGNFVRLLNGFASDDDLATVGLSLMSEVRGPELLLGTHKFSHSDLDLADGLEIASTVTVDHHKSKLLNFLEEVGHCESVLEVGVERVGNLFCLTDLDPLTIAFLLEHALWVTLAESVQVFQLASRHVEIYLHLQTGIHHNFIRII